MDNLTIGLIVTMITQTATLWYKMGRIESAVKKACPFGACPLYERATAEAAPKRVEGKTQ